MNTALTTIVRLIGCLVLVVSLPSCEEQDLAKENEELADRLAELKEGVRLLKADIKNGAIVLTADVQEADKTLAQKQEELRGLEKERDDLDKKHARLNSQYDQELRAYQRAVSEKQDLNKAMDKLNQGVKRLEDLNKKK